jgi:hypothetical protein
MNNLKQKIKKKIKTKKKKKKLSKYCYSIPKVLIPLDDVIHCDEDNQKTRKGTPGTVKSNVLK